MSGKVGFTWAQDVKRIRKLLKGYKTLADYLRAVDPTYRIDHATGPIKLKGQKDG